MTIQFINSSFHLSDCIVCSSITFVILGYVFTNDLLGGKHYRSGGVWVRTYPLNTLNLRPPHSIPSCEVQVECSASNGIQKGQDDVSGRWR